MSIDQFAVREVCRETDRRLWNAYPCRKVNSRPAKPFSRLMFPCANGKVRVSEQEARFAFVESVLESEFFYSVETPTSEKYRFSGEGCRAAQTDLTLRDKFGSPVWNTEFKMGVTSSDSKINVLYKDAQKLLREPVPGIWFHLLKSANVNNKNFSCLLQNLSCQFSKVLDEFRPTSAENTVIFHICVLRPKFSIHKRIDFSQSTNSHENEFEFSYKILHQQFEGAINANGWDVCLNNCV